MEARKCPDCGKLVNTEIQLIDEDHPEDGECIACSQCGYCFEYLEDENISKFKRFCQESEIIKSLWKQ
jgi:DNA-directed RNA polymerase subunit RPC12/RpoP